MRTVRVRYTVTFTGDDGNTFSFDKERVLTDIHSTAPDDIQQVIERDFLRTEKGKILSSMNTPLVKQDSGSFLLVVTNISTLEPTGDDDQM